MVNRIFHALLNEAHFTKEILDAGATQIREARHLNKGMYFLAFTSLSTGLERIGKLCLMLDYYIRTQGKFPDLRYVKGEIGHDLVLIYEKAKQVIGRYSISFRFLGSIDDEIYQNILTVLSGFARGDRYSNIDLLVGEEHKNHPMALWFDKVDQEIFRLYVPDSTKGAIQHSACPFA